MGVSSTEGSPTSHGGDLELTSVGVLPSREDTERSQGAERVCKGVNIMTGHEFLQGKK